MAREEMSSSTKKLRSDAMRGKWSEILKTYKNESTLRTEKITATGDTLLHMAVSNRREKLVENMVDLLLVEEESRRTQNNVLVRVERDGEVSQNVKIVLGAENDEKNTPLHLAAIRGNVKMCKKIGGTDRSLIARPNITGETPLFLAALSGNKEAFLWLHYLYLENPGASSTGFAHCIRDDGDTILHCAIGEGHLGVAIEIVHLYKDHMQEMMKRNNEGLSPLHLLASKPSALASTTLPEHPILRLAYSLWTVEKKNRATTFEELRQEENRKSCLFMIGLIRHLPSFLELLVELLPMLWLFSEEAVHRSPHDMQEMKKKHTWWHQIMTELLQHASDEESESGTIETPLMIAVKNGVVEMVEKILELFPSRIKDVNADRKNMLLLAVEYRQTKVLRFLCKQEWITGSLFRQEDNDGNNALHLAALSSEKEINWFKDVKDSMPGDLLGRYNRKMEMPEDIYIENHNKLKKSEEEWMAKTSEACSVVSTLVVSVAFSTRTNVPGGYGDNGYAILRNKPLAFKTFKESSFVALFFSLISTICFLSIIASRSQSAHFLGYVPSTFYCGVFFMFVSIACLWISFCAADFFMLHDDPKKLHKVLPTYIWLTCGVILVVVLQLPIFIRPRLSRLSQKVLVHMQAYREESVARMEMLRQICKFPAVDGTLGGPAGRCFSTATSKASISSAGPHLPAPPPLPPKSEDPPQPANSFQRSG